MGTGGIVSASQPSQGSHVACTTPMSEGREKQTLLHPLSHPNQPHSSTTSVQQPIILPDGNTLRNMNSSYRNISCRQLYLPSLGRYAKCIMPSDYEEELLFWIKEIQKKEFRQEMENIINNDELSNKSQIKTLQPILDELGRLRVGGRLNLIGKDDPKDNLEDIAHPIILHKDSKPTEKIIFDEHIRSGCMAGNTVHNNLKRKYWMINGRVTINKALRKTRCLICAVRKPAKVKQSVAPLPIEQLIQSPTFTYVEMDLFGHFYCKDMTGEKVKKYGLLLTDFCGRLTHVELLLNKSTEEVILALDRTMSRRGVIAKIYCDCSMENESAEKDYEELWKDIDLNNIIRKCTPKGTEFVFGIPQAKHRNGVFERIIGVLKRVLKAKMSRQIFTT